jgi:protein-tyrosine phosphatase
MVDLHTHIMFGWDDGAVTIEDSLRMARLAADDGIRVLAATPHFLIGGERVNPDVVRERVAAINASIAEEGLDIRIITGCEIQGLWDNFNVIKHGQALMLGDSRTLLFETPFRQLPLQFADLIFQIRMLGITPLLAHPERSDPFLADFDLFNRTVGEDIPVQLTTTSLLGGNGERIQDLAWKIARQERPVVVASDAHGHEHRRPLLSSAHAMLTEAFGEEAANLMCRDNAAALLANRPARIARIPRQQAKEGKRGLAGRLRRMISGGGESA